MNITLVFLITGLWLLLIAISFGDINMEGGDYIPSRQDILTQCEQIKDYDLLDQCIEAAEEARK